MWLKKWVNAFYIGITSRSRKGASRKTLPFLLKSYSKTWSRVHIFKYGTLEARNGTHHIYKLEVAESKTGVGGAGAKHTEKIRSQDFLLFLFGLVLVSSACLS